MLRRIRSIFLLILFIVLGICGFLYFNTTWGVVSKQQIICIVSSLAGVFLSIILLAYDIIRYIDKKIKVLKDLLKQTENLLDLTIEKSIVFDKNIEEKKQTINELLDNYQEINDLISKKIKEMHQ